MSAIGILCLVLAVSYILLLGYFISGWIKAPPRLPGYKATAFASIVIPVRNEQENIIHLLSDIASQDYPRHLFEVIAVDDSSEDNTVEVLSGYRHKLGNMRVIRNENGTGKKSAIANAIDLSKGELIITVDGDCRVGPHWLSAIISFYEDKKPEMIIGPVCFQGEKTFFDKAQSLEFLSLAAITGGSALAGNPVMCNGANLAYTKKGFMKADGFKNNEQTPSGDDMLLMMKFKKEFPGKIMYFKSRDAIVYTRPIPAFSDFVNQRKRWVSKSRYYGDHFVTGSAWIVLLFNLLIIILSLLSFVNRGFAEILVLSVSAKFAIDFLFLFLAASFFNRKSLLWLYIPVQIMYVFYVPFITVAGLTGSFTWKGRAYRG